MTRSAKAVLSGAALVLTTLLATGPAVADKPEWAGGKKSEKQKKQEEPRPSQQAYSGRFTEADRLVVREYYDTQYRSGKCPPGLAKKKNGCLPPGQAKKWQVGHRLPPDVVWHDVPRDVIIRLPPPPKDHRYVRVAADILLIAIGTSMVIDAIEDLGR